MSSRLETMANCTNHHTVPNQRPVLAADLLTSNLPVLNAALAIQAGRIVLWENGPVVALAADANDPNLQMRISGIKKDRSPDQPLGWITPFSASLGAIDVEGIEHPALQKLFQDPDALTKRLGALSFIRANANMAYKAQHDIPDAIMPAYAANGIAPTVQIYSPTTNERCSRLVRYVTAHGVRLAMTSANYHKQKEIVTSLDAEAFAQAEGNLQYFEEFREGMKPVRPRGSYPVLRLLPDRIQVVRHGFLDPKLMAGLLDGLPVDMNPGQPGQVPNYPANVLRLTDLSKAEQQLRGADLHNVVIGRITAPADIET